VPALAAGGMAQQESGTAAPSWGRPGDADW
jgi:hypothetical protein